MSKVKIKGNASGTGVLTIEAPNTDTDRTITLPDEDITLGGGADTSLSNLSSTGDAKVCKAWVNFNGTGTVAIRDSHNVSSITDNGTGDYTITLSNAMANTNWCPVITHRDATYEGMSAILGEALTTTTVRLGVRQGHVTAPPRQDTSLVAMVAFGD